MPLTVSYPGVYVAEVPGITDTVTAAPTSTAAFVGWFPRGAVGRAIRINGLAQFQTELGGLHRQSEAAYAVTQFFANGGSDAWIIRLATDARLAVATIPILPPPVAATPAAASASQTIGAADDAGQATATAAELIVTAANPGVWGNALKVFIATNPDGTFSLAVSETADVAGTTAAVNREDYRGLTLTPGAADNALAVVNGRSSLISLAVAGSPIPPGAYPAATGGAAASTPLDMWVPLTGGLDGALPTIADLDPSAVPAERKPDWLDQLQAIPPDDFDILCIPDTIDLPTSAARIVFDAANGLCAAAHATYLLDIPAAMMTTLTQLRDLPAVLKAAGFTSASSFASATYTPALQMSDPLDGGRSRIVGPSGTMAGVIARIDTEHGIWTAPAGTEAGLAGVQIPLMVDNETNGVLNSAGINVLRDFPIHGPLCWGARTMAGADEIGSDWKYINVRRLVDYIERSLSRSLQWVVFEPNDETLWSRIRVEIDTFLHGLFVAGAFSGTAPASAFFVMCDATTTSEADVAGGVVRIAIGVAPSRPAEFVILQIEQATAPSA